VSTCGTATFPSSTTNTAPFTVSVGVNFCVVGDPCTAGQPQILAVTGSFNFDRAAPAFATSTCSGTPGVPGACPRVPHYSTITYFHWVDNVDHDFDCIATTTAACSVVSTTPLAPNGCLIAKGCHMDDVNSTPADNEVLTVTIDRTEQGPRDGWVDDRIAYPNGQAQQSGSTTNPWVSMPDCIAGGTQLPTAASVFACLDKSSSASYQRASTADDAPLTVVWRFIGDPRTHAPAI
jgi:hypothetical protein